ncbi:MAG: MBL fold metallo-hydrolase [Bacteroidales bacterium]|nr:MBL fold metallo-hydrolase [Bacteroidales bacterium]
MKIKRFVCNAFQENAYVVSEGADCIIIDPGFTSSELPALYDYLAAEGLTPTAILLTHSHPDHVCGLQALVERFGIAVQAGAALYGFTVIKTPGHTPDSVCYYNEAEHILFTGDTLFAGTIGRTDLPGGNYDDEIRSIMEKLIFLPGETVIYPGHGPASTIARERIQNPFLEPFNEREELDLD